MDEIVKEFRIRKVTTRGWVLEYRFGDQWIDHTPRSIRPHELNKGSSLDMASRDRPILPGEIMAHMEGTAGMDENVEWRITMIKEVVT
jgi:hypothetical protein